MKYFIFGAIVVLLLFLGIQCQTIKENMVSSTTKIPKIIIQTWKNNEIPEKYRLLQKHVLEQNPDYEYKFFTDKDIDVFLSSEYPDYYKTFNRLPVTIQKIDFFRYIAVYHFGGFYYDLDMESLQPLDDAVLSHSNVFPIDDITPDLKNNSRPFAVYNNKGILLGQYAFGGEKGSLFMKLLVDNIHNNIDDIITRYKSIPDKKNHKYVYETTGPEYVTNTYIHFMDKSQVFILDSSQSQFFGKYARHCFYGTWKN